MIQNATIIKLDTKCIIGGGEFAGEKYMLKEFSQLKGEIQEQTAVGIKNCM